MAMLMVDFSAYSPARLQEFSGLLQMMHEGGVADFAEAKQLINQWIAMEKAQVPPASHVQCPSCESGILRQCHQSSQVAGVPVMVCSARCGYSSVWDGQWPQ